MSPFYLVPEVPPFPWTRATALDSAWSQQGADPDLCRGWASAALGRDSQVVTETLSPGRPLQRMKSSLGTTWVNVSPRTPSLVSSPGLMAATPVLSGV